MRARVSGPIRQAMVRRLRMNRRWLARLAALGAALCMAISAWLMRPAESTGTPQAINAPDNQIIFTQAQRTFPPGESLAEAVALAVVGGVLLAVALVLAQSSFAFVEPGRRPLHPRRTAWPLVIAGAGLLLALAEANGRWLGLAGLASVPAHLQFALLVGGTALVAWGLAGERARFARLPLSPPPLSPRAEKGEQGPSPETDYSASPFTGRGWRDQRSRWGRGVYLSPVLPPALITLLAFGLRIWDLNEAIHAFVDELNFANAVRWYWVRPETELLHPITGIVAFPRLYAYLQWGTVAVYGRDLAGLRLVSAIAGTLTVPALYLLGRALFDRRTGLLAAGLLAACPPHLHYSRLALNNIADPLFGTLALAFLALGLRSGRRRDYALAGAMLGLTQYFYEGGRVVFPAVTLLWLAMLALAGRGRPSAGGVAILLLAAALVAAPVYVTLLGMNQPLLARSNVTVHPGTYWRDLLLSPAEGDALSNHLRHVRDTFLVYTHLPEGSYFYGGDEPLIPLAVAPLLLLGTALAVARWRAPGPLLLLLWTTTVSLGNSFLVINCDSPRYVAALPALMLLSAAGLRATLTLLWPDREQPRLRVALVAGLLAGLIVAQASGYFGPHLDRFNRDHRLVKPYPDGEDALFRAASFPPHTQIHLVSRAVYNEGYARDMLKFLTDRALTVETLSPGDISLVYWRSLSRTLDHAFFIGPEAGDVAASLRELFPNAEQRPATGYPVPASRRFTLYYVPALQPGEIVR